MDAKLQEAVLKLSALKKQHEEAWAKVHAMEQRYRGPYEEARELDSKRHEIQETYLESIGMPVGKPPQAFMVALANTVGSDPCHIEHMLERGNSSRYDRPVAQRIYDKARNAVPEIPEVAALRKKVQELRETSERIEKEVRESAEYRQARSDIYAQNWPMRQAQEDVERCRKNEEARERRKDEKADPSAKVIKATREKLNAILAGEEPFTWKP